MSVRLRLCMFILFLGITGIVYAQDKLTFNIVSCELDNLDLTAQSRKRTDGNGDLYAIIKFKDIDGNADLDRFTFDFGALRHEVDRNHDGELWIYVQRNAKTVTIKHPRYKTIEKYDLGTTIQAGKTYVMKITIDGRVKQNIEYALTKQVLQFKIKPVGENAMVMVKKTDAEGDYEPWGAVDNTGSIDKLLDFGTYDYIVSAPDYISSEGRIKLYDSKQPHVENVTLKPDFGFLTVEDTHGISGAQVFVDGEFVGNIPFKDFNKRWRCGTHTLTVTNGDLYKPYSSTFTISRGDTVRMRPHLTSDFAETTIRVEDNKDAEILIDGKPRGQKSWKGPLKAGRYVITARKENHRETSMSIEVKVDRMETFTIPAPEPITGSVYVSSRPSGATIYIDGEFKGNTPQLIPDVIIGEHKVTLALSNHKTEQYNISVKEGVTENVEGVLSDIARMKIDSKPTNTEIFINGSSVGRTPYEREMPSGDYHILLRRKKYKSFSEMVHLDSSTPVKTITLVRQYQQPNAFYIQPFIQAGQSMAFGGSIGGYICNVNVEAFYAMGMTASEMIYWNSVTTETLERPFSYTYKPTFIGGKVGYGVIVGTRLRVTPQIGYMLVSINGTGNNGDSKGYASSAAIGCKVDYVVASFLSVNIAPEYDFEVSNSNIFKQLSNVSPKIKSWVSGINCRIGLSLNF